MIQKSQNERVIVFLDGSNFYHRLRDPELGKKIEYIGFSHRPSFAMQRYANLSRLLSKIELEQFLPKTLF